MGGRGSRAYLPEGSSVSRGKYVRGDIWWTRRGLPFWEDKRSDGTMAPSWRDPDLLPRVAIALTVGQSAA